MLPAGNLLPETFYLQPVAEVARNLLGMHLHHGAVVLRIVEVEAYGGPEDTASHCRFGRTARNAPMWEAGGRAYVYVCYGLHHMLNIVTGPEGEGSAVLVRSCECVEGLEIIQERRGGIRGPDLLAGPGRVAQALGIDRSFNGHLLHASGGLELREGTPPGMVLRGPRIGIPYADLEHREAPLRYAIKGSRWVTARSCLSCP